MISAKDIKSGVMNGLRSVPAMIKKIPAMLRRIPAFFKELSPATIRQWFLSRWKKIVAAAVLVALAAGITVLITVVGLDGQGPRKVTEQYVAAINQQDFDAFVACFPPNDQKFIRQLAEKNGGPEAFLQRNYEASFSADGSSLFGDNITITMENPKTEKAEVHDGVWNGIKLEERGYSAISLVYCDMVTKGSKSQNSEPVQVVCVKIDRHWYILTMNAGIRAEE